MRVLKVFEIGVKDPLTPNLAPVLAGGRRYFARVGWWRGCPARDGNLRAKASSEDLEGVKYIHLQRVMGRTGDTRRCPRPRELPRSGLAGANVVISCFI